MRATAEDLGDLAEIVTRLDGLCGADLEYLASRIASLYWRKLTAAAAILRVATASAGEGS